MNNMDGTLWTAYNGRGGSVRRVSSQRRADMDVSSGRLASRQQQVLAVLLAYPVGATYGVVGGALGLHHGQSSAALSNLHRCGMVFQLGELRDGCHPYVHHSFREDFLPWERIDSPAETLAGKQKRLHQDLWDACSDAVATNFGREACMRIKDLLNDEGENNER